MITWNLTSNVDAPTATPTLKHNAFGDCSILVGTAYQSIYAVWIEVDATSSASTVRIVFEPASSGILLIDESLIVTTLVPPTHGGAATWNVVGSTTTTRTIDFDVPSISGTTWGWDFEPGNDPPALKMKVRVKRL